MADTTLTNPTANGKGECTVRNLYDMADIEARANEVFNAAPSQNYISALSEEGMNRMCALYDLICSVNPRMGNVSFTNERKAHFHFSFPRDFK